MTARVQRDFYDVESLAEQLGLTPRTVREMAASGELPARKVAGKYIFSSLALHEWLAQARVRLPHREPTPEFEAEIDTLIERFRPLLERLADE